MMFELTINGIEIKCGGGVEYLGREWENFKQIIDSIIENQKNHNKEKKPNWVNQYSSVPWTWTSTASTVGDIITVKAPDPQKDELDKLIKQRDESNKTISKQLDKDFPKKGKKRKPKR